MRVRFLLAITIFMTAATVGCVAVRSTDTDMNGDESETVPATVPSAEALSMEALMNATYSGIYSDAITLTEGEYEGEPFVEGGASRPRVAAAIYNPVTYGDLTNDGADEALVLLTESSGGSGTFNFLAAMDRSVDGEPVNIGTVMLGDRVQIKSVDVTDGNAVVEMVAAGPEDALCCPTQRVRVNFALVEQTLTDVGTEELGTVSLDSLDGTSWVLLEMNIGVPVQGEAGVTLTVDGDEVRGNAGCNDYGATLAETGGVPQQFAIGEIVSTEMACEDETAMEQEAMFLSALGDVAQWSYVAGNLALTYQSDNTFGSLIFASRTAE